MANPFAVAATLTKADPVWLGDLIRDGFYDKLVLIGFPYDEGARKAGNRRGADFGPGKYLIFSLTFLYHLRFFPSIRD